VEYRIASGNSYKKKEKNYKAGNTIFSIEFSDYGDAIVSKVSLRSICTTI